MNTTSHSEKAANTLNRRHFIAGASAAIGGAALLTSSNSEAKQNAHKQWDNSYSGGPVNVKPQAPVLPNQGYRPIITPNGIKVPFKIVDGVKCFYMTAAEFSAEIAPGLNATVWSYNQSLNGAVIEAVEGERVRIYVHNKLAVPTTVHWHGLFLPNGMDGVSGITQAPIPPGEIWKYEFTLRQHGTYMFHAHHNTMTQEGMGLTGMFIIHPRHPSADYHVDRDFSLMLNEYRIEPGTRRPDPTAMNGFNILTINGKAFPGTAPLVMKTGDRVRIRIGNLSAMDHHPIHLHGYRFKVVATDGDNIPVSAQQYETSVLVAVGQTRTIEFIADAPGDWIMHCHMTHHTMNQMGHELPNLVGVNNEGIDEKVREVIPDFKSMGNKGMSEHAKHMLMGHMPVPDNSIPMLGARHQYGTTAMGGMFTLVKVRDQLESYDKDPGWYQHPKGTQPSKVSAQEIQQIGFA